MSSNDGISRVQQELNELREKALATSQRDKLKDLTGAVTNPEEAAAFLAAMRDKSRAGVRNQPPANLSADGYDAWFLQQKERERELKKKRQEAEALLRGYRSSLSHQKLTVKNDKNREIFSPSALYESGEYMDILDEDEDEMDESGALAIGRLNLTAYFDSPDAKTLNPNETQPGRLNIEENSRGVDESSAREAKLEDKPEAADSEIHSPEENNGSKVVAFDETDNAPQNLDAQSPDVDVDEKKDDTGSLPHDSKEKPVPTPAKQLIPHESAWRDFVSLKEGARFPSESGRYHLYVSFADPGSHRVLIVRALKGLEDAISVTVVHPTWRRTRPDDPEDGHRGWVFGDPDGDPFTNTAGRGGPFPASYPGNEPDPLFKAYSIKEIYEQAGDTADRFTVPILWDKEQGTIVNNESSDIAYMLNSRFNQFAKNVELDLYTESDEEKLDEIDLWIQPLMINGVYRCGFAKTQAAYEKAIDELTCAFDKASAILEKQRFLAGDTLTDADVRLFVTLFRFDEVYAFYFKTNTRLVMLTPSLLNYCRDFYQMEGIKATCDMEQIKAHFFGSHAELNKFSIIPRGLGFNEMLSQPHNRDVFPAEEAEDVGSE